MHKDTEPYASNDPAGVLYCTEAQDGAPHDVMHQGHGPGHAVCIYDFCRFDGNSVTLSGGEVSLCCLS